MKKLSQTKQIKNLKQQLEEANQEKQSFEIVLHNIKEAMFGDGAYKMKSSDVIAEYQHLKLKIRSAEERGEFVKNRLIDENEYLKRILEVLVVPTDKLEAIEMLKERARMDTQSNMDIMPMMPNKFR